MLQVHNEGKAVVVLRREGEGRVRRRATPRARPLGDAAAGLMLGRRIQRDRKGGYRLRLPAEERDLLRVAPGAAARRLLARTTRACAALFPPRTPTTPTPTTSTGADAQRAARGQARRTASRRGDASDADHLTRSSWRPGSARSRASASSSAPSSTSPRRPTRHELDPDDPDAPRRWRCTATSAGCRSRPSRRCPPGSVAASAAHRSGLDEHAPGGQLEACLHRVVDRVQREDSPSSGASSSRPAATCSSRIGSATAGSSDPYIVPVRNFSRRRNSAGSRSRRSPVGGSPTITVVRRCA